MRVLVCGPRDMTDYWQVHQVLDGIHKATPVSFIIEGCAHGADRFARRWAEINDVDCLSFEADWKTYGKGAGARRNGTMLHEGHPDRVVAFIATPPTPGTANMVAQARRAGVPVLEIVLDV